jgi:hypothetical protein
MSLARYYVLSIPFLLVQILFSILAHSLLYASLTSRTFHAAITSTPHLQTLLFFRPSPANAQQWLINAFSRTHFLRWFALPEGHRGARSVCAARSELVRNDSRAASCAPIARRALGQQAGWGV